MGLEIERKFLVKGDFARFVKEEKRVVQGYIYSSPEKSVRVRILGKEAFLTIKGPSDTTGISRYEFELAIPLSDADQLLYLCEKGIIEKVRHYIPAGTFTWEVDVFHGDNEGLIMAEIELGSETDRFELPNWLGEEVTGDPRYYNAMLSQHPYTKWNEK